MIGCGLWTLGARRYENEAKLWAMLMFVQSLPFLSALVMSMINALRLGRRSNVAPTSLIEVLATADGGGAEREPAGGETRKAA
jgi:hypothetical protein